MKKLLLIAIAALPFMLSAMEQRLSESAAAGETAKTTLTREECADRMQEVIVAMEKDSEENVPTYVQMMRDLLNQEHMDPNDIIKRFYHEPFSHCLRSITHCIPLFFEYHDAGKKTLTINERYDRNLTPSYSL